ncbi:rho guanine nucleotide exchange factor 37 isoform X1 [Cyprinodon tularosa]|uniref:rho guanine nucleotide exchange factor 37 isoform X1 n=2 Tax=Cyprinodon tularosa TaxID=77115 RepID=UPI0018E1DC8A|nr:rho guanine nucleotide exchange factor 37 isoform X1 [Cyprinodon tularosa]
MQQRLSSAARRSPNDRIRKEDLGLLQLNQDFAEVIFTMEVPSRPPPSDFKLRKSASSPLRYSGAIKKVSKKKQMGGNLPEYGNEENDNQFEENKLDTEEETVEESVFLKPPTDSSEVVDVAAHQILIRLPSQDSFSEESFVSEERLAEEAKKKKEEEEAAAKERQSQRQMMAIEELAQSEKSYLRMLQICTVNIRNNLQNLQPPPPNLDSVFLYIDEVMDVSGRLLSMLDQKQLTPENPDFLETLCTSFLSLSSDIEAAYKEYLRHYNHVSLVENSYKQKEALWNDIVTIIKTSAPEVNATSLSFFLVMPVQRIARYPLLLQTIQKHTDPSHPAYGLLEQTAHTSVALNCRINEYKRFREVADKYKKTENLTIIDKINRLNTHSIAKKTARFSQHIKHETGMVPKLVDEEFDALEGFFNILEDGILVLLENVETYLLHLQRFLECKTEEFDFDMDGEKTPICYKEIKTALRQWILPMFEKRMRVLIYKPLCDLRDLLVGPKNLIRKRLHKLLDYEVIEGKSKLSYDEQAVANAYKTINTLLLNELPRFNGLALQMIWRMLGTFSCLHRDLAADMEQVFQSFAQQLPHSSLHPKEFQEWVESAVLEGARQLETLCQSVEEALNAPAAQPLSPSSQRRLKQLTDKHGSGKIFQVTSTVVATRDFDLNLTKGELVALISETDTRGDKRRWLVDAGGKKGYVASAKLARYHQAVEDPPPSPFLPMPADMSGLRRHSCTPDPQLIQVTSRPLFQVIAAYDFTARGNHEVSVHAGEPVRVLEPHDKRGNPEWSLVEARGQRGYVPSNYLTRTPVIPSLGRQ